MQYSMPWRDGVNVLISTTAKHIPCSRTSTFLYTVDCDKNSKLCTAEGTTILLSEYILNRRRRHALVESAIPQCGLQRTEDLHDGLFDFFDENDIKTYHKNAEET